MEPRNAAKLNQACDCRSTDARRLAERLGASMPAEWAEALVESHPTLFAPLPVFVSREELEGMRAVVRAVERVVRAPAYAARVLEGADETTRLDTGARGVFLGLDFHLGEAGPQLIEINTNAGGALLQLALARSQQPCCEEVKRAFELPFDAEQLENRIVAMFREELALTHPGRRLTHVAIVDVDPDRQFLRPEFELFASLFERHGVQATIADPTWLRSSDGGRTLHVGDSGTPIDLVYLRSTDFRLATPSHATLREAFLRGGCAVTPPPRAHALYADKANLALLSSAETLRELGIGEDDIATLTAAVPETRVVHAAQAEAWWVDRKRWFFKPRDGFGSRAAYRGEKLTRRVFDSIVGEDGRYVAQRWVAPSERLAPGDKKLKFDVRCFVYDSEVMMVAARLYQGQTTNLRTEGGGLATVLAERDG